MPEGTRPEHKRLAARIYTPSGWIVGNFHVPQGRQLLPFLNETKQFFTLTDVQLPGHTRPLSFLAVQRSATILVVPAEAENIGGDVTGVATTHQVSCLLHGGLLMGALRLPSTVRVSDHLMATAQFFLLRDCTIGLDDPQRGGSVEATRLVLVNASRLVGVAEVEGHAPSG